MYSLIIKNCLVIDGSGQKPFSADVAVEGDVIAAVHKDISAGSAKAVIDAKGLILAPGFIDTQNHSDSFWQIFDNPTLDSLACQGYTTAVIGNSGVSLAPLISSESIRSIQKWVPTIGLNTNWRTFTEYKNELVKKNYGVNLASLVGYSTVRRGLLGDSMESPTKGDLEAILMIIQESLRAGAKGVSVGLGYAHELNVSTVEVVKLAELCAQEGKVLSIALRDEGEKATESVAEFTAIAEQTGVKIKISHLKLRDKPNWDQLREILDLIESAWHRGAKIAFDSYPYDFTLQPLYTYLPSWCIEGGRTVMLERLKDPKFRQKAISSLADHPTHIGELIVASTNNNLKAQGRSIGQLAKDFGVTSEETAMILIENGGTSTLVFDYCLNLQQVNVLNNHALGFVATNGGGYNLQHSSNLVHPRSFGSSAKFLRHVIDSRTISLEEAISKLTHKPAEFFELDDRGLIAAGNKADLVLFDPKTIDCHANIANPYQYPIGISKVWVAGVEVVNNGSITGKLVGNFLA